MASRWSFSGPRLIFWPKSPLRKSLWGRVVTVQDPPSKRQLCLHTTNPLPQMFHNLEMKLLADSVTSCHMLLIHYLTLPPTLSWSGVALEISIACGITLAQGCTANMKIPSVHPQLWHCSGLHRSSGFVAEDQHTIPSSATVGHCDVLGYRVCTDFVCPQIFHHS